MRILFVTGRLAEPALRQVVADVARQAEFEYDIAVLPITVAALLTPPWIARHLTPPPEIDRVMIPGHCSGDLQPIRDLVHVPVERGPIDLRDLPQHFGQSKKPSDYGNYNLEILAEINHAPRLDRQTLLDQARQLHADGADIIDLGCDPGQVWDEIGECVRMLREAGLRVSVDSFESREIAHAVRAGAELVLSVNRTNLEAALDWGCEVVVLPDRVGTLDGLDETITRLDSASVPFRIDAILEPIGFGFAGSLGRYLEVRRRYPTCEILMGVGNLTELTDVDSAGVNVLLAGFCQEAGIRSVLTTQVINWARSSVRELDLARRLMFHACTQKTLPKHCEPRLLTLRDPRLHVHGGDVLARLAEAIKDRNFRLFAEAGLLHVMNDKMHLTGDDPFTLFQEMTKQETIDPSHAFYLGYELAKAVTALTLGKNYVQDQALTWGHLTRPEVSHRLTPEQSEQ